MIIDVESDPRHAGQISRYHTWPTHRTQSVGEHTWQIMRIMLSISASMCTSKLMCYAVLHDVGEMAGDIPWPGKRNDAILKERMDIAEQAVRHKMEEKWGQLEIPELTELEHDFFKMCEYIEMWEFGLQETSMGNKYGAMIAARMLLAASKLIGEMPQRIRHSTVAYVEKRKEQEREFAVVRGRSGDPSDEIDEYAVEKKED